MKRKRHQRSGSDGLVPEEPGLETQQEVEDEDRLKRLLEAAVAAMPEVSDGDGEAPADSHHVHSDDPVSDSKVERTVLVESAMTIVVETAEEEMTLTEIVPNMRRCGLCGGTTDGEPAADNPSEVADGQANGGVKPHDESCLADVTLDTKKADGFGAGTGWLGRLLGPLGEQFGVGGVWVHENCAIWSPEVYFSGFGRLKNVKAALRRGRLLRCSLCNHPGATIGCRVDRCPQNYHLPCARAEGCMFNHRKYLMACYDHSHLFKRRRKKRYWVSKSRTVQQDGTQQEHSNLPRISKTQRRAAAAAARLKDIEAEEKYLDKAEEDEEFVRRERKRLQRDLAQIAPLKLGGGSHGSNQGVAPEGWDSVAGLQDVVRCLKEMVTLPLLYPEAFTRLGISAPRGVLLHGHPGTGKTLVVRALAGACSRGGQQVAYFARKGADILGKYVGDSERQLRLLFQVAEQCQPAIIFFDEIDGLAPSRCGDRDQTQSSVVSTLLALMDGLSSRGSVVVIGATNRPDSLDPALRRPGRFDREIYFPLPSTEDRASILRLHTRTWNPAPSSEILAAVAKATPGFAGADLQALCVEAAMTALRRVVPLKYILDSAALKESLEIRLPSLPSIQVKAKDWAKAVARAPLPCSRRLASSSLTHVPATPLPRHLAPALLPILVELVVKLGLDARVSLPPLLAKTFYLTELALTAESNLQNTEGSYFSNKGVILPEKWQTMVVDCFKETTSGLGKALEYAFLDTGIMVDAYGAPHYSQSAATVRFENAGIAADEGWVTSKYSRGRSNYEGRSSSRRISNDNDLDEMDTAAQQKYPGCKFRVLLLGGAKQGQKVVAGAVISGFEGLAQTRTLSLPAMLMEGGGDIEQGLIYIIGEARRSAPCVLYMPKIEDWVVSKDKNDKDDMSGIVKHPEGFGISNAGAEDSLHERFGVNSKNGDEAPLDISVAWKVMKQQLQTMPPDTQLMLLATCESGVESLPLEVVNYFSPQFERTSRISSFCAAKVSPCVLVEFSSNYELKGVLERASQDIASALASGFGSRMARLREEYIAGCSAEKPKLTNAAGVRLPTSLQQAIADKVSQIRTRVREDLGRDLRTIGQDWARILGGSPYANDLAKVFGMDVGRGLGLDLGLEFKNLECGLVEEANKECNIDVGGRSAALDKHVVDASCTIGSNERSFLDILEDHERSAHCKGAEFVISGGRSLDFNEVDVNEHDTIRKTLHSQDVCTSTDRMNDTRIHQVAWDKVQREGQPTSEFLGTARVGDSVNAAEESSATWTPQRKALQSAIAFCGYRLLRDPQLAGLRSATTMLKRVPVVDINEGKDSETFNWETLEYETCGGRRKDEAYEPEYVRGLTAVGFKACRGIYRTGREVEYELRRVIETLSERVHHKIDSGKDSLQYFHLTTQAATLVDLMASWVLEVRKLEIAANMHNVPIAQNILEDPYVEEQQQESDEAREGNEATDAGAANEELHTASADVALKEGGERGSIQVENGFITRQESKINCNSNGNGDVLRVEASDLIGTAQKSSDREKLPTTPNVREIQPLANGIPRGAYGCFPSEHSQLDAATVPAEIKSKRLSPGRYGARSQHKSHVETTVERDSRSGKIKLLSSFKDTTTSETCLQQRTQDHAPFPHEGSTSTPTPRTKGLRQSVRFKPDCLHQLECVVGEFLNLSCKVESSNPSVEVLHDLITGCASSALAAAQNVLSKSEKTTITHQVILQWAGLTCRCGSDKDGEVCALMMGGSSMQLSPIESPIASNEQVTPISQASSRKSKKRKKSRMSFSDLQAPPAKKLGVNAPETSHASPTSSSFGLISPMKQSNSKKSYTCLRPVSRAVKKLVDDLAISKESNLKFTFDR